MKKLILLVALMFCCGLAHGQPWSGWKKPISSTSLEEIVTIIADSSGWERNGTRIILVNSGDSVGVGGAPTDKFSVTGNVTITGNLSLSGVFLTDIETQQTIRIYDTDGDTLVFSADGINSANTYAAGKTVIQMKDGATTLFEVDSLGGIGMRGTPSALNFANFNIPDNGRFTITHEETGGTVGTFDVNNLNTGFTGGLVSYRMGASVSSNTPFLTMQKGSDVVWQTTSDGDQTFYKGDAILDTGATYTPAIQFKTYSSYDNAPWRIFNQTSGTEEDHVLVIGYNVRMDEDAGSFSRVNNGEHLIRFGFESGSETVNPGVDLGVVEFNLDIDTTTSGTPSFDIRPFFIGYDMDTESTDFFVGNSNDVSDAYLGVGTSGNYGTVIRNQLPGVVIGANSDVGDYTVTNRLAFSTQGLVNANDKAGYVKTFSGSGQGIGLEPGLDGSLVAGNIYLGVSRPTNVAIGNSNANRTLTIYKSSADFVISNTAFNKNVTTAAQGSDTSAIVFELVAGLPALRMMDDTGNASLELQGDADFGLGTTPSADFVLARTRPDFVITDKSKNTIVVPTSDTAEDTSAVFVKFSTANPGFYMRDSTGGYIFKVEDDSIEVQTNISIWDSTDVRIETSSLADDAELTLKTAVAGRGDAMIGDNQEYSSFRFSSDGTVTLIANTANVVNTDTDGNLCIYDAGTGIRIKNRLGSSLKLSINVLYYVP